MVTAHSPACIGVGITLAVGEEEGGGESCLRWVFSPLAKDGTEVMVVL